MALTARVNVTLTGQHTSVLDFNTAAFDLTKKMVQDFANGTGLNQASKVFTDTRAVLTAATDTMDLNGGTLVDAFGVTLVFATVKALIIRSSPSNTTNLTLFGDANSVPLLNTAATTITLQPGGLYVFTAPSIAGVVVTAGTGDIIKLVNAAGATANYDIAIIGT
jgi:hypothetical protein